MTIDVGVAVQPPFFCTHKSRDTMKPKEYMKKYNLDKETRFPHDALVADLTNDFVTNVEYLQAANQMNFNRYKICIKEIKSKFDGIANKSIIKQEIWDKLWKYFFATVVIKLRDKLFSEYMANEKRKYEERKKVRLDWESYNNFGGSSFFNYFNLFNSLYRMAVNKAPEKELSILELDKECTTDDVKSAYRCLIVQHHPDKGGSADKFREMTEARNKCLAFAERS